MNTVKSKTPTLTDVKKAYNRIRPYIRNTPVHTSGTLNKDLKAEVFFKCENFQKTGSFKIRGACNVIYSLSDEDAAKGVCTHSSGNHAQALAFAALSRKINAIIVMPENASSVKINAVAGYGGDIRFCEPTQEAREAVCSEIQQETGAVFVPPFNDNRIIAGQGTASLELLSDYPELDMILTPVGGGGLLGGTAIAAKGINPKAKVIGTEPEMANDAYLSFKEGMIIPVDNPATIADGLKTSLGELTFAAISDHVFDIVTVSEKSIIDAMRYVWERMKIIIEPSSAVPVAALMSGSMDIRNKRIGIIISGGNVSLDQLPWDKQ
ncbi:MAG: pyridoxal-phosphate dependent enzyme [Balneolales bacterium]